MVSKKTINESIKVLVKKYPDERERIKIGVTQISRLWQKEDGTEKDFINFAENNFEPEKRLDSIFNRYNEKYGYFGYMTAMYLRLRLELDEDRGELLNIDRYFANLNPLIHLNEDLFKTKIAFLILLNFKIDNLKYVIENMNFMTRKDWAINRMTKAFNSRVPSSVSEKITKATSKAEEFIYSYNIPMGVVLSDDNRKLFDDKLLLISHWGLRDELKSFYTDRSDLGIKKQKTIYKLMERVIYGEIPSKVLEKKAKAYNPFSNEIDGKKNTEIDLMRYDNLKNMFEANREEDKYNLVYDNYVDRIFSGTREIPFDKAENLMIDILSDDAREIVGNLIKKRLQRNLEPFDIWYNGFVAQDEGINLDEKVKEKYPTIDDFQKGIKNILIKLDFDTKTAETLASRIEVDPARGAGHAWGPAFKGEVAHLRTRLVDAKYMNWQSFNTAMHELGHCVEQNFSLYDIDYNLLSGVPNIAFTEAMAFVFQNKSLDILGIKRNKNIDYLNDIQIFWDAREIAGVSLVDMYVWKWMYKTKKFTPEQLKNKVIEISKNIWNKYYYPVFGVKDIPVLAIYSHMIFSSLYLPDYTIGHIIAHQIENHFKKVSIGKDMKRICQLGNITPMKWMKEAVGSELDTKALIEDAKKAARMEE
jgi:hypothetical protein